jgi:hypothetical protein
MEQLCGVLLQKIGVGTVHEGGADTDNGPLCDQGKKNNIIFLI